MRERCLKKIIVCLFLDGQKVFLLLWDETECRIFLSNAQNIEFFGQLLKMQLQHNFNLICMPKVKKFNWCHVCTFYSIVMLHKQFLLAITTISSHASKKDKDRRTGWIHLFHSNHPGAIHPISQIVQWKTSCVARN